MERSEARTRAKIPAADTGVEIRKTMCDICTPGPQCGVDAYVKDGRIIKMEGTDGFPGSDGRLCVRGAAGRQYLYRPDRIRTPLRRTGPRGGGQYEPISWDEALDICARELLKQRETDPDGVVFLTGYPKWYRPYLHRLAHSFGTQNYLTESSACHRAEVMSYKAVFGQTMIVPIGRANTVFLWGANPQVSSWPKGRAMLDLRDRGGTIVVIDPRMTQAAQQLATLYLRPRAGTDAALAHAMAHVILKNGWHDADFIARYVHGFEPYREYVQRFTPEYAQSVTGVPAADIVRAAELLAHDPTAVISPANALTHRENGFNTHRAVISLMVLLGRVDRPGGVLAENDSYCHSDGGFVSRELDFIDETRPKNGKKAVGCERFPLWDDMVDEGQGMDLVRQMEQGTPYPIRALACFGVNDRMYPESPRLLAAMDKLDFSFAVDIFWTDVCAHADIVLPACTSYERGEVRCYGGRFVNYSQPAVAPLYESRPDTEIIFELSRRMGLGDARLDAGYDACIEYIFAPSGITDWQSVKDAPLPVPVPNAKPYEPGRFLKNIQTPTGKLELYSEQAAKHGLDPLPRFIPASPDEDYPLTLIAGGRLPHAIHSRLHEVAWLRSLRPEAELELCQEDAARLGIESGDAVTVETRAGRITAAAKVTETVAPGEAAMYHGYREANVNAILPMDCLDPYTGFPAYKQFACRVFRAEKEAAL